MVHCTLIHRSFSRRTIDPFERLTKVHPYNFPEFIETSNWYKVCPNWLRYLNEAKGGARQLQDLLQAWLKYAILPRPKDRKAEIEKSLDLFGSKGTGKSTSLEVLIQLVGAENVGPVSPDTFKTAVGLEQLIDKDLAVDSDCSRFLENIGAYIAHLGIVYRRLGDSCQNDSNSDTDRNNSNSCRQLEPTNLQADKSRENDQSAVVERGIPNVSSTTVSIAVTHRLTTVSEQSVHSPPTVSIPETIQVGSTIHKCH